MAAWSGLGMNLPYIADDAVADQYLTELKARGFSNIRVSLRDYTTTAEVNNSKNTVLRVLAAGMLPIWGVTSNPTTITTTTWPNFRTAVLAAAQWAQDNGVYEFQVGNEEELHIDNSTVDVAALCTNIKNLATEVQAVFTRGNVSYSCVSGLVDGFWKWDRGGLDLMAMNAYMGYPASFNNDWYTEAQKLITAFGSDHTYISEFSLSSGTLATYSTNEEIQARELSRMIEKYKAIGITRALFFSYVDANLGCKSTQNGDYRLIWNVLSSKRRWFING